MITYLFYISHKGTHMNKIITVFCSLMITNLAYGDSYLLYSQGKFEQSFKELQLELKDNKIQNLENALDMAQDIWSQSPKMPVSDIIEIHDLVLQKEPSSYLKKRVASDIKYLSMWSEIKKLSKPELLKELKRINIQPDDITKYNHDKKSKMRIYQLRYNSFK